MSGLNKWGFGFIFTAMDLATPTMKGIERSVQRVGSASEEALSGINKGLRVAAGGLALFAAGVAGLAGMKKLADVAGEFEFEMKAVEVITGAVGEELDALTNAAMDAGLAMTQFAPAEAAQGLRIFSQAGFEAAESMEALTPTLDLAAASIGQLTLDKASGLAVSGLRLFGFEANQSRFMMDRMAKATVMSSIQFKELPLAIGVAARGVIAMNASLEDTLIGLGLVRNIIPTTERAATAFATSLEKLSAPKSKKAIQALGIEIANLDGELRPVLDIIGDLGIELDRMTQEEQKAWVQTVFGKRSMAGLFAITRQLNTQAVKLTGNIETGMVPAIEALRKKMAEADGTAVKLRDALLSTWKGMKQVLSAQVKGALVVVGDAFAKVFFPITKGLATFAQQFAKLWSDIPEPVKKAIAGVMALVAVTTAITGAIIAAAGAAKILTAILAGGAVGALVIFGKVLLVIGLVVGAIIVMKTAWEKNFGGIRDLIMPFIDRVVFAFQVLFELFRTGGTLSGEMGDKLTQDQGLFKFVSKVFMIGSRIIAFFEGVGGSIGEAIDLIGDDLWILFSEIGSFFTEIGGLIGEVFNAIAEAFGFFGEEGTSGARGFGVTVVEILTNIIRAGIFVVKVVFIPLLKVFGFLARVTSKVLGPILGFVIRFGILFVKWMIAPVRILVKLIQGDLAGAFGVIEDIWDGLKGLFFTLINFWINSMTSALAIIMLPLRLLAEAVDALGIGGAIGRAAKGIIDFHEWARSPIDVRGDSAPGETAGRTAGEAGGRGGKPRLPGLSPAAASSAAARAIGARYHAPEGYSAEDAASAPASINIEIKAEVGGDEVEAVISKLRRKDNRLRGRIQDDSEDDWVMGSFGR